MLSIINSFCYHITPKYDLHKYQYYEGTYINKKKKQKQ